ncbi:hypothetical protein [Neisseria perflava]|uniref:hypothetical protein n=1 Tax=Neisseria perflava TaxID=33053 RepID=UPI003F5A763C
MFLSAMPVSAASKIYTCETGGVVVYTSRPSASCRSADLPSIGSYSSSRYDEYMPSVSQTQPQPSSKKRAAKSSHAKKGQAKSGSTKTSAPRAPVVAAPIATAPRAPANNSRRAILESELSNERRALAQAQKALAQARTAKGGSVNQEQVNALQATVSDRQQNIQALQRELGRM